MSLGENLETTTLSCAKGSIETKIGDKLDLINPDVFSGMTKTSHEHMNKRLVKDLGNPPYELLKITKYSSSGRILLDIKGEKGSEEQITRDYFTK